MKARRFRPIAGLAVPVTIALSAAGLCIVLSSAGPAGADPSIGVDGWGTGASQQCSASGSATPQLIALPSGVTITQVAPSGNFSLFLASDGAVYACGANGNGQLGQGYFSSGSTTPLQVQFPAGVQIAQVSANGSHALALSTTGVVYEWGQDAALDHGNTSDYDSDVPLVESFAATGVPGVAQVIAGPTPNNWAISTDGRLFYWENPPNMPGGGVFGCAGEPYADLPVAVALPIGFGSVVSVADGGDFYDVLSSSGSVYAFGFEREGGLGNGVVATSCGSNLVSLPEPIVGISAGFATSMAWSSDGNLYAWGQNAYGQIGNGTTAAALTPVQVPLSAGVGASLVAENGSYTEMIDTSGGLWAWGDNEGNSGGALGDGTTTTQLSPVRVELDPGTVVTDVADNGAYTTLAVVERLSQSVTFSTTAPTGAYYGGPVYNVSASASSTETVTYSIDASAAAVCSLSGQLVNFIGVGTCTIDANQAGDANYGQAQAQQSFTVAQASQTVSITSTAPANATVGGEVYAASATGGASGNPVTFQSDSPSICTVSGSTVSFVGVGTCAIEAGQAGNSDYEAGSATQSFSVGEAIGPCGNPAISRCFTSGNRADATVGSSFSFPVTTAGTPSPKITEKGKLPRGVKFYKGFGTASLAGTPTSTTRRSALGTYPITITATYGKGKTKQQVTQSFTLTVSS